MLGLFAELVNLLPPELRSMVTFSTFSAALPHGTVCHMRGVYDADRAFDAASATQPWVDCAAGRVAHAEMLPALGASPRHAQGEAASRRLNRLNGKRQDAASPCSASSRLNTRTPQMSRPTVGAPGIAPSQPGGGRKAVFTGLIILLLVLGLIGGVRWRYGSEQAKGGAALAALEAQRERERQQEIRNLEEQDSQAEEQAAEEERKAKELADAEAKRRQDEKAQREREQQEAKERQEQAERKAKEKEEADARIAAAAAEEAAKRAAVAFLYAESVGIGKPKPPTGGRATDVEPFKVFYYAGDTLTNEVANFTPLKLKGKVKDWSLWVHEPSQKQKPLEGSPCVVWLKDDKAWYDWSHRGNDGEYWLGKNGVDEFDLQVACFGPDENVFNRWKDAYPDSKYRVTAKGLLEPIDTPERRLALDVVVGEIGKNELETAQTNLKAVQEAYDQATNQIALLEREIAGLVSATNECAILKQQLKDRDKARPKKSDFKAPKDKANEQFENAKKDFDDKTTEMKHRLSQIKGSASDLAQKEGELKRLDKEKLADKVAKAEAALEQAKDDPELVKRVRGMKFTVEVVPEGGKEEKR